MQMPLAAKKAIFQKIGYEPHSRHQWAYHESGARYRVPCCGRRFGKSTMAGQDKVPSMFQEDVLGWIVGPTYDLAEKEFRVMWDSLIIQMKLGQDKRVKKAFNKRNGEMYIEMPWGARVECRSAAQPDRLVGEHLHWCIMSEAAKQQSETWERFIRPSLTDFRGTCDFPTTPEGFNWLYDLWQLGHDPTFENYESWCFPSWTNPVVFPEGREDPEILELERTTTPEWFLQEIAADFSAFVGKIYDEFTEKTHVKPHVFNPAWPNYIAWDFGYVNPCAAIEFQVDPQDNIYIWREHYKSYTRVEEHCAILQARDQPPGYHLDLCFGDPADPEAVETISINLAPCVALPECKTNWRSGVDEVKRFLKLRHTGQTDEYGTPELAPKLWVDPTCRHTIREFNLYKAPESLKSNARESGTNSVAVKEDDHCMDAIRYGIVHIYQLGATASMQELAELNRSGLVRADTMDLVSLGSGRITLSMEDF